MNYAHIVRIGLWVLPVGLQLLIAAIMVKRHLVSRFSFFFAYCLYAPTRDLLLLFLRDRPNLYSWIYWLGEGGSIMIQLAILWSVSSSLLRPHPGLRSALNRVLEVAALAALVLIVWLSLGSVPANGTRLMEAILLAERSARFVQVTMLLIVIVFIAQLGLTWRDHACGILLGFGVAGFQLIPAELRANLHLISNVTFSYLMPAIYDCAVLVWAAYFLLPRKPDDALTQLPTVDMKGWDNLLNQYLSRQ